MLAAATTSITTPFPLGMASTPCSWRGCGCPWFLYVRQPISTEIRVAAVAKALHRHYEDTKGAHTQGMGNCCAQAAVGAWEPVYAPEIPA